MNLQTTQQGCKATDSDIERLAQRIGRPIPPDYSDFLRTANGCRLKNNTVHIDLADQHACASLILGIGYPDDRDIFFWINELSDDIGGKFLPIGFDPGGNAYIMDISRQNFSTIYYWDSARAYECSNSEFNAYEIASSFSEFLESICYT